MNCPVLSFVWDMFTLTFFCLWMVGIAEGRSSLSSMANIPFLTVWNAPTEPCGSRYHVDLDLGIFDIVLNRNQSFMGGNITIFYENRLGRYPYYTPQSLAINGGVPQNASLQQHLRDALADIEADIPQEDFLGLAVVDWESWRPLWERNWDTKRVYCEGSRALVRAKHPDWNSSLVEEEARREFQEAGQAFMEGTLRLGQEVRPGGLWGFYGFPCCYNNQYKNGTANYTGKCPDVEVSRNNKLDWLWNISSALYPDLYLEARLRGKGGAVRRYASHRVREALRVAARVTPTPPPVLPYARIAYTYSLEFLSQEELVYTIGESAALGAAGVVLWGDANYAKSQAACEAVKGYLDGVLGHYLVNVTTAAALCSRVVCSGQGRCQRRHHAPGAYLHLDPRDWSVSRSPGGRGRWSSTMKRPLDKDLASDMATRFDCQCFQGWAGRRCNHKRP